MCEQEPRSGAKIAARVSRRLSASPRCAFDAWLDPDRIRVWMGPALKDIGLAGDVRRIEVDASVGDRFNFFDMRDAGEAVHWGTYLAIEPPRRLVFTWFSSDEDEQKESSVVTAGRRWLRGDNGP